MLKKELLLKLLAIIFLSCVTKSISSDSDVHFIGAWWGGLFASFNCVLNHLFWCEHNNKIPVVHWDHRSLYYVPQGFNGSHNVWEYYFEPVSSLTGIPASLLELTFNPGEMVFYCENQIPSIRLEAYRLINKYIKIKPIIQKKIDAFYQAYMANRNTIGIHLRGTDKYKEEKPVSAEKIVNEALKYVDKDTQFLIATDEEPLLHRLITLLKGHTVIVYNCYRSNDSKPLHYKRKPSLAQVGEDVLVEVALLAKCNKLIHTMSNVSTGALYMNPYMENILVRES